MIFVTMVSIFARFCSVMEMCIAMIMVMSSYFSIGKGFIIHKIIMVVLVTLTVILLDRTRLHQVDGGGYVYGDDLLTSQ